MLLLDYTDENGLVHGCIVVCDAEVICVQQQVVRGAGKWLRTAFSHCH